ncbi:MULTISPECIES: SCP2 sterol-binding domain-containing protein [unclassified Psychrobacter]|uniref:SCP2 sterol-binding domain-containing protein n=1 Tax=unclassified Psychrobacter TaxID=196806 RepID=UPI0025B3D566|nr:MULTISPECIES: SCP2 sterol-binding domain-containing protein [unclassified Psychrobacter]MDN3453883.1 SCP2 sterol-binding domain-containing protein [Psychrobacter sp. APC 3350]MDN3503330.1 SCP2 sterol-binding domain-containing protein [Psychrobacter sp. 5A.1]
MFTVPVLDIKSDPLDALLAVVGYRLSMLADSDNEDVKALFADRQVTIEFASTESDIARSFSFDNGRFSQQSGHAKDADLTITFKDSMTGVRLLTKGSLPAFMTAVQEGNLSIEGDYSLMMWFNKLAKHIVPAIPEECQPYFQKAKPYAYKAQKFAEHWVGVAKHKLGK